MVNEPNQPVGHSEFWPVVERLAENLIRKKWTIATAESCTGGWVAKACTDLPGSSEWYCQGLVTYSNSAKGQLLGVPPDLIDLEGAVSEAVARAMANGLLQRSGVDAAVAVTGIAGPDGGSKEKPVGTVYFAWAAAGRETVVLREQLAGTRDEVRRQSVAVALNGLLDASEKPAAG